MRRKTKYIDQSVRLSQTRCGPSSAAVRCHSSACTALTIAELTANLVSAAPLACVVAGTETWALGPLEMDFDSALYLLPSSDG